MFAICFLFSGLQSNAQNEKTEIGSETTDSTKTLCNGCYTETWLHDSLRIQLRQHQGLQFLLGKKGEAVEDKGAEQIIIYDDTKVPHTVIDLDESGNVKEIKFQRDENNNRDPTMLWFRYDEDGVPIEIIYHNRSGKKWKKYKRIKIGS